MAFPKPINMARKVRYANWPGLGHVGEVKGEVGMQGAGCLAGEKQQRWGWWDTRGLWPRCGCQARRQGLWDRQATLSATAGAWQGWGLKVFRVCSFPQLTAFLFPLSD